MIVIGLTGSIATGKTTVAKWLIELDIPVFEADAYVHHLFTNNQDVILSIQELWPHCVSQNVVDRSCLRTQVLEDPSALNKLEMILHPRVKTVAIEFIQDCKNKQLPACVLDVPLLYESSQSTLCDCVLVVYCSPETQRQRATSRGVPPSLLDYLTSQQLPLSDKIFKADFKLNTDGTLAETRQLLLHKIHEIENRYDIKMIEN